MAKPGHVLREEEPHNMSHLSVKQGSLFVCFVLFVLMRSTEPGCFRSHSWSRWKALVEEGCIGFGFMAFELVVQKFKNIE
jgi:hypothetical protein